MHGILVQLPLPAHIDARRDRGDRSGQGCRRLSPHQRRPPGVAARPRWRPARHRAALILVKSVRSELAGLEAVVIGRSKIVGKPMAQLLLGENCTVTIAHSRTRDLPAWCAAPTSWWPRSAGRDGARQLDQARCHRHRRRHPAHRLRPTARAGWSATSLSRRRQVAGAITPVPGGVGPMTVACLLREHADGGPRSGLSQIACTGLARLGTSLIVSSAGRDGTSRKASCARFTQAQSFLRNRRHKGGGI